MKFIVFNLQLINFREGLGMFFSSPILIRRLRKYTATELNFYHDQIKWRHILIPIEVSKNDSDRVIDLMLYKNHYALIKKLNVFLGEHDKKIYM